MEVKAGYKQTEIGAIPEDWEVKQIGDLEPFVTSQWLSWLGCVLFRPRFAVHPHHKPLANVHLS